MRKERIVVNSVEEFIEGVKKGETVSRYEVQLGFKWNTLNSAKLRAADLNNTDLSGAYL